MIHRREVTATCELQRLSADRSASYSLPGMPGRPHRRGTRKTWLRRQASPARRCWPGPSRRRRTWSRQQRWLGVDRHIAQGPRARPGVARSSASGRRSTPVRGPFSNQAWDIRRDRRGNWLPGFQPRVAHGCRRSLRHSATIVRSAPGILPRYLATQRSQDEAGRRGREITKATRTPGLYLQRYQHR